MSDDSPWDYLPTSGEDVVASVPLGPLNLSDWTNEQIDGEIRRLIEGAYDGVKGRKKFPANLKPLAEMILDKGQTTADEYRRSAPGRQHAWQRKDDLQQFVPINAESRTAKNEAIYRFDYDEIRRQGTILKEPRLRDTLTAKERAAVYSANGDHCSFCGTPGAARLKFQIDHAIPFKNDSPTHYLVACASCNRRKGHACKYCPNYEKDAQVCYSASSRCLWACQQDYPHTHVETRAERLVQLPLLSNEDILLYDEAMRAKRDLSEEFRKFLRSAAV